jgi:hypothetical protein
MAYIRKVKTASGAIAVQIAYTKHGRIIRIDHIGSSHTESELGLYKTGVSIKRFVKTMRPIRSGIVNINGQDYPAEAEIPNEVIPFLQKLKTTH